MMGMNDDVLITLNYGIEEDKFMFWNTNKLSKVGEWAADFYFPAAAGKTCKKKGGGFAAG